MHHPDREGGQEVVQLLTPSPSRSSNSPEPEPEQEQGVEPGDKKKKKKKRAKKVKAAAPSGTTVQGQDAKASAGVAPPPICISRNKHWRYISSYHGPWLQLPLELLDSLLVLNSDRISFSRFNPPRTRSLAPVTDDGSLVSALASFPHRLPTSDPTLSPPIDPGVLSSVTSIRRLVDEASELAVRASSGLSAAALAAQSNHAYGLGTGIDHQRHAPMSATRVHRLRALAVQKLAQAYRADEVAASVMIMQVGSVFDDLAERVLKFDPTDVDARYVHFFHEKIPSRHLAASTQTTELDALIAQQPQRLELYRTRGIVHCFRDEFALATRDFTYALKDSRARRKAHSRLHPHQASPPSEQRSKKGKGKGKKAGGGRRGQAPADGTAVIDHAIFDGQEADAAMPSSPSEPDADPMEQQCLFYRGAAYLQQALCLVESIILSLENVRKPQFPVGTGSGGAGLDGGELRLSHLPAHATFGGIQLGNLDGPLGPRIGEKAQAYRTALAASAVRSQVEALLKRALRDHERFLAHFDRADGADVDDVEGADLARRTAQAFCCVESLRPGAGTPSSSVALSSEADVPSSTASYHPLLIEARFGSLLCKLLLGDFRSVLHSLSRAASALCSLDGCPVFLPPRSVTHAEFVEVLERLACGWRVGVEPHSFARSGKKPAVAAIAARPLSPPLSPPQRHAAAPAELDLDAAGSSTHIESSVPGAGAGASAGAGVHPCSRRADELSEALDYLRMLLAPVPRRRRERVAAEQSAREVAVAAPPGEKRLAPIHIPLHGPRVDVILAWLAAVHLFELEEVA